jgi:hypothetical protein
MYRRHPVDPFGEVQHAHAPPPQFGGGSSRATQQSGSWSAFADSTPKWKLSENAKTHKIHVANAIFFMISSFRRVISL